MLLCKEMELLGGELVAVDGSKFKAVNSGQRNFSRKKLEKRLKEIDQKVERYLDEMDRADQAAENPPTRSVRRSLSTKSRSSKSAKGATKSC